MGELIVLFCLFASGLGEVLVFVSTRSFVLEPPSLKKASENSLVPNGRIVGGVKTDIRDVPYQMALEYMFIQYCGAVLISEYYFVTAGHCLSFGGVGLTVRLGSSTKQKGGIELDIEYLRSHYKFYDMGTLDYDIAVGRLLQKAPLGPNVKPVKVADKEVTPGTILKVSGWGVLDEYGTSTDDLYSVELKAISREECQKVYSMTIRNITNRMVCAYTPNKDSCYGDSGGPAVSKGVLYGLVGWGRGCARPNYPGVYTNVADPGIRQFIRDYAKV